MKQFFVYILKSEKTGRYYIGSSYDPNIRLQRHNANSVTATRNKGPWIIVFKQAFKTNREARANENRLKKFKRRDIIERIINDGIINP